MKNLTLLCLALGCMLLLLTSSSKAIPNPENEGHIKTALRLIGHQVLLLSGDSTSRVLPVEQKNNRYRIQFESEFPFNPDQLVKTINGVIEKTQLAKSYLVEVERCKTEEVVYSYEIGNQKQSDLVPCAMRNLSIGCYDLYITLLDRIEINYLVSALKTENNNEAGSRAVWWAIAGSLLALGFGYWWIRRKKKVDNSNPNIVTIGEYRFDTINLELEYQNQKTELSSKEADLLYLLHSNANTTLQRGDILKDVWGDEGGYIGRTLDVFISKLRKKLEADPRLRIVNVRGVGYRFIVNG